MYAKPEDVEKYLNNSPKKPYILCEFIAIATICRQTNSNKCMKERTLRLSFWQVKMGKNFSF
jgi:hypothetical protein